MAAWLDRSETIWEEGAEDAVALETATGEVHTRIRRTGGEGVEITVHEQVTNAIFPVATDYTLLREELSIAGRDAVFESILDRAAKLAGRFA
jgi:hypothetical protein